MKSNKQLAKIAMDIYREMYAKATPKADFDKLMRKGITKKRDWFMSYYLDDNKQQDIINKHCKGLLKMEKRRIEGEVYLGCSPTGIEKYQKGDK